MAIQKYNPNEIEETIAARFPSVTKDNKNDNRIGSFERGYGAAWTRLRRAWLQRYPACVCCKRAAHMVDHIRPIRYGGEILDTNNLQSMCSKCHAAKTLTDDAKAIENGWEAQF